MMASPERKGSSLLSLIAAKAIVPGSFSEKNETDDEQRTQTMMYAARMKYLDDTDQIKPDSLFMTRKQAQKVAQRHDTAVTLKKLDGVGPPARKANAASSAASPAALAAWKRANYNRASVDERHQVWEAKFQAGCHFWQNVETMECRASPPPNAQRIGDDTLPLDGQADHDDEDLPFPDSFTFLGSATSGTR